jgi:hypothetical protein
VHGLGALPPELDVVVVVRMVVVVVVLAVVVVVLAVVVVVLAVVLVVLDDDVVVAECYTISGVSDFIQTINAPCKHCE